MNKMKTSVTRIGMGGSLLYENKTKIKETVWKLQQSFGDDLVIVSGGRKQGADKLVRKYVLDFGIRYREFNPAHEAKNLYSHLPEGFYGKPYNPRNYFVRNSLMVKHVDFMIIFKDEKEKTKDITQLITETEKINKKLIIME